MKEIKKKTVSMFYEHKARKKKKKKKKSCGQWKTDGE